MFRRRPAPTTGLTPSPTQGHPCTRAAQGSETARTARSGDRFARTGRSRGCRTSGAVGPAARGAPCGPVRNSSLCSSAGGARGRCSDAAERVFGTHEAVVAVVDPVFQQRAAGQRNLGLDRNVRSAAENRGRAYVRAPRGGWHTGCAHGTQARRSVRARRGVRGAREIGATRKGGGNAVRRGTRCDDERGATTNAVRRRTRCDDERGATTNASTRRSAAPACENPAVRCPACSAVWATAAGARSREGFADPPAAPPDDGASTIRGADGDQRLPRSRRRPSALRIRGLPLQPLLDGGELLDRARLPDRAGEPVAGPRAGTSRRTGSAPRPRSAARS